MSDQVVRDRILAKDWNASEALYAFAGWLTSRPVVTIMSARHDAAPIVELVEEFCKRHHLPQTRYGWEQAIQPEGPPQDGLGEIDPAFYRPTIRPLMGSQAPVLMGSQAPVTEAAPTEPASSITGFDAPLGELRCARCNSWDVRREDEEEVRCCSCGWKTDYYEAYKQAHPDLFTTPASLRRPPAGETRVQEQDREIMRQREQIDYIRKALLNLSAALGK